MKRKKIIPLVILAAVVAGGIIYYDIIRKINFSPDRIEGSGTIEVTEIEISPKIAGRIVTLPLEEGDRVKANQPVVSLAYDELEPQKVSAFANLSNAEKSFSRAEQLYKTGSLSKQAYDNALTAYTAARSQYELVIANIRNALLSAPIDGVVLRKNAELGELAFPGTPIIIIADTKKPWIKLYVPETRIGKVAIGNQAEISVDSFDKRIFKGRVIAISNKAEFTPRAIQTKEERVKLVFAVKILIENENDLLKPGMPADAVILTGKAK